MSNNDMATGIPAAPRMIEVKIRIPAHDQEAFQALLDEYWSGNSRFQQQAQQAQSQRETVAAEGLESLYKLYEAAQGDTGQCRVVARFLVGLYNGQRFPFDLTDLRTIDDALFEHCMRLLRMDARQCKQEVHTYFDNGSARWERLISDWGLASKDAD